MEIVASLPCYSAGNVDGQRGTASLYGFFALYRLPLALGENDLQRLASNKVRIEFLDYDWKLNRN